MDSGASVFADGITGISSSRVGRSDNLLSIRLNAWHSIRSEAGTDGGGGDGGADDDEGEEAGVAKSWHSEQYHFFKGPMNFISEEQEGQSPPLSAESGMFCWDSDSGNETTAA